MADHDGPVPQTMEIMIVRCLGKGDQPADSIICTIVVGFVFLDLVVEYILDAHSPENLGT